MTSLKAPVSLRTRPEAIKLVRVVLRSKEARTRFDMCLCVTDQHRQMLDPVVELIQIRPDYASKLLRPGQILLDLTSRLLDGLRTMFKRELPADSQ